MSNIPDGHLYRAEFDTNLLRKGEVQMTLVCKVEDFDKVVESLSGSIPSLLKPENRDIYIKGLGPK